MKEVHQKFTLMVERRTHTHTSLLRTFPNTLCYWSICLSHSAPSPVLTHRLFLTLVLSFPPLLSHLSPISQPPRCAPSLLQLCAADHVVPALGQKCGSLPNAGLVWEKATPQNIFSVTNERSTWEGEVVVCRGFLSFEREEHHIHAS